MQNDSPFDLEASRQLRIRIKKAHEQRAAKTATEKGATMNAEESVEQQPRPRGRPPKKAEERAMAQQAQPRGLRQALQPALPQAQPLVNPQVNPQVQSLGSYPLQGLTIASTKLSQLGKWIYASTSNFLSWVWQLYVSRVWRIHLELRCSQIFAYLYLVVLVLLIGGLGIWAVSGFGDGEKPPTSTQKPTVPAVSEAQLSQLQHLGIEYNSSEEGQKCCLEIYRIGQVMSAAALSVSVSVSTLFDSPAFRTYASSESAPLELLPTVTAFQDAVHVSIVDTQTLAQLVTTTFTEIAALVYHTENILRPPQAGSRSRRDPRIRELYVEYLDQLSPRIRYLQDAVEKLHSATKNANDKGQQVNEQLDLAERAIEKQHKTKLAERGLYAKLRGDNDEHRQMADSTDVQQQQGQDKTGDLTKWLPELSKTIADMQAWVMEPKLRDEGKDVREHVDTLNKQFVKGMKQTQEINWGDMVIT